MATYVNNLRLKEITTGDESGTWGTSTNLNLELIGQALGYGTEAITTNADTHATTIADGAADEGRALFLKYTGTLDSACTITLGPNTVKKVWIIENATSGSQNIIISQGSGANITIAPGKNATIYTDGAGSGAAVLDAFADLELSSTLSVAGATTLTGVTTHGGNVVSDTDSTDDLGTTGVRWANLYVDDVVATTTVKPGTLVLAAGSITDTSGAITFGNENLVTTGTFGAGATTLSSTLAVTGASAFSSDMVVSADGAHRIITIGDGSSGSYSGLILRAANTQKAWKIVASQTISNGLEFIPGTSAGNTTFTTPTMSMVAAGVSVTGTLGVTGATTLSSTLAVTGGVTATSTIGFLGSTASAVVGIYSAGTGLIGTSQYAFLWDGTFSTAATAAGYGVATTIKTAAGAFTCTNAHGFYVGAPVVGASSAITNAYGLRVLNQGKSGVTNSYGIHIAAQSGSATTNIGLYNAGTTTLSGATALGAQATLTPTDAAAFTGYGINYGGGLVAGIDIKPNTGEVRMGGFSTSDYYPVIYSDGVASLSFGLGAAPAATFAGTLNLKSEVHFSSDASTLTGRLTEDKATGVADGGTFDLGAQSSGGKWVGMVVVSNISSSNANISTQTVYLVNGQTAGSTFTSTVTSNGSEGGFAFGITMASAGVIRITNNGGSNSEVRVVFLGSAG